MTGTLRLLFSTICLWKVESTAVANVLTLLSVGRDKIFNKTLHTEKPVTALFFRLFHKKIRYYYCC